ncbi:DUF2523 domain-containing protein [Sinimarinibacterium flocculans]|uniref:Uncharacterized protein DUF2523 n=1 Tax=Sinimarinibacterium flocculans TaxID=985250 RepID=A0A318E466_9GAMM|nr:DUF2523 domain-containing protein [Sinimarinibacterium flocculans]PXV63056.1 uncharacterized protein DUF2523 [Sinimarinibacterium flocculans]
MPLLASLFAFLTKYLLISAVLKVLTFLGFAFISYQGATTVIDYAEAELMAVYGSLPSVVVTMLQILHFDYAVSILFAALTFKVTYGLATRFGPRFAAGTPGVTNGGE